MMLIWNLHFGIVGKTGKNAAVMTLGLILADVRRSARERQTDIQTDIQTDRNLQCERKTHWERY